ncbi:PP_RS20740 family protein [Agrobacterium sp. El2ro-1b]|uniref:PP_RS20740 family protein n=1 Tax=Agrobacterium sp. El2ro-1b TaxID=2969528 RepID=UPI003AAB942E
MIDDDGSDDFAEYSLPPEAPPPSSPEALIFAPWHKPRKQYIRRRQWIHHVDSIIERLADAAGFNDGHPLRYMTLPGPDLLDVRMMADLCAQKAIKLRYTGFCYGSESEERRLRQNVSEFALTHQGAVVSSSRVVRSRLQQVSVTNSEAFIEMEKGGPYDVVNIDACEPLANDDVDTSGRLVDTIRDITKFQLNKRRTPWLLFLTTPIQVESISAASLQALHTQIVENAAKDEAFASAMFTRFEAGETLEVFLDRLSSVDGENLISVFSLGVAKWLIHLAEQAKFRVIKLKGFSYSMFKKEPFDPNMVSLAFLFEPTPLVITDGSGLTQNPTAPPQTTKPVSDHVRAINKAFSIENLDETMKSDPELYESMKAESKQLLASVGYPVDHPDQGYDQWIASLVDDHEEADIEPAIAISGH